MLTKIQDVKYMCTLANTKYTKEVVSPNLVNHYAALHLELGPDFMVGSLVNLSCSPDVLGGDPQARSSSATLLRCSYTPPRRGV